MFSRFTNALYNAVDALAPPHPLQEDFIWHWKSITRFFTGKNASSTVPIESTSIPGHLSEMLSILEQEENEIEVGNVGPCMEYIMQHKLLDTMCVLATSDSPPGMKRSMITFITKSLSVIQESLIPHVSVCVPIQNFIKLCGEVAASPTELEEMDFLESICDIIQKNPPMFSCFFIGDTESVSRRNSVISTSSKDNTEEKNQYILVVSLLKLYQSPDNNISARSKECIKTLCSSADDASATAIVQVTNLSHILCSNIITFYRNIPRTIKINDLENPIFEDDEGNSKISPEMRKYLCYLQHLNFLDILCKLAHPVISDDICLHFKSAFLDSCVYPELIESDNVDNLLFVTTLVACSLRGIKTPKFIDTFAKLILDDDISEISLVGNYKLTLKDILIERCNNCDADIALAMCTLQLFEELLINPTQFILTNLVLKYIDGRGYYDYAASDSWLQFSDDDACSRYSDDISDDLGPSKSHAPSYINRIMEAFLALLPDDIKSCESEEESGYETYIKEAHNRFMKCLIDCEGFDWPVNFPEKEDSQLGTEDDSSSESQPEADSARWNFYEGPFLRMIFDKLEQMLFLPHEINLQITAIISRIALFANPYIHEYFLNPLIPYVPGIRTLFTVLFKVSEDIQKEVPNIGGYKTKLKLTRNALLSDGNEYATFEESNILEALIVLEEFCKELAAITFVKYHTV